MGRPVSVVVPFYLYFKTNIQKEKKCKSVFCPLADIGEEMYVLKLVLQILKMVIGHTRRSSALDSFFTIDYLFFICI